MNRFRSYSMKLLQYNFELLMLLGVACYLVCGMNQTMNKRIVYLLKAWLTKTYCVTWLVQVRPHSSIKFIFVYAKPCIINSRNDPGV